MNNTLNIHRLKTKCEEVPFKLSKRDQSCPLSAFNSINFSFFVFQAWWKLQSPKPSGSPEWFFTCLLHTDGKDSMSPRRTRTRNILTFRWQHLRCCFWRNCNYLRDVHPTVSLAIDHATKSSATTIKNPNLFAFMYRNKILYTRFMFLLSLLNVTELSDGWPDLMCATKTPWDSALRLGILFDYFCVKDANLRLHCMATTCHLQHFS